MTLLDLHLNGLQVAPIRLGIARPPKRRTGHGTLQESPSAHVRRTLGFGFKQV